MSAKDQIMEYMTRHHRASTREISEEAETSQGAVYVALSDLVAEGRLVRLKVGEYGLPGEVHMTTEPVTETKPRKRATKRRKNGTNPAPAETFEPPPVAAAEVATDDPPIELAVWHTGELTGRRDETSLVLTPGEVGVLMRFLSRFAGEGAR